LKPKISRRLQHVTETVTLCQAHEMIISFKHKELKRLFEDGNYRRLPAQLAEKLTRRLDAIDTAVDVSDLILPGFNLHELKGARKGTWRMIVTGNWRITLKFTNGDASDVDLEDYH
jgi:toxin HigB-1